jgi:dienelactone hydrolase
MRRAGLGRVFVVAAMVAAATVFLDAAPASADTSCAAIDQAVWGSDTSHCSVYAESASIVMEKVAYPSDGVSGLVGGYMCRPKAAGTYPIVVLNHGGFEPDALQDYWISPSCTSFALGGYIAIASNYRPYDTSADTFCDGEVDDVLAMLDLAKTHAQADADRVVMRGWSHGACITLRAYQRGVDGLVAAAAIAPPTDMDGEWQFLNSSVWNLANACPLWLLGSPPANPDCTSWWQLKDTLEHSTGGTPSSAQAEYDERSVDEDLAGLHNGDVPLLISQGVLDEAIPVSQTCATVSGVNALVGAPDFVGYHFTGDGTTLTSAAVSGCTGMTWSTASDPNATGYPGSHYLFMYDGLRHWWEGDVDAAAVEYNMFAQANFFLLAKTPSA